MTSVKIRSEKFNSPDGYHS